MVMVWVWAQMVPKSNIIITHIQIVEWSGIVES